MTMLECPDCEKRLKRGRCPECGWTTPGPGSDGTTEVRQCWVDGTVLRADGFCATGQGYPLGTRCPFACPLCRHELAWDGGCGRCYGSRTPADRATWTRPGDRYEVRASHQVRVDGPGRICTAEEVAVARRLVDGVLGGVLEPETALRRLGELFRPFEERR